MRRRSLRWAISTLAFTLSLDIAPLKAAPQRMSNLDGLDAFIPEAMQDTAWGVPGLAIAVVQDGRIIFSKGYGFRDVENGLRLTTKTLFPIGSVTKPLTASLLAILADEGKLDWDRPVREYLPNFPLHDLFATERATTRDLLSHRTGLPRHDAVAFNSDLTRKELIERLRHLEPNKDFRTTYQYNNLMVAVAGYLAEQLSGKTWDQLIREKVLVPLGMVRTTLSIADLRTSPDFARGYTRQDGTLRMVAFRDIGEMGPAGAINSNVEDMAQFLLLHLNRGKFGKAEILTPKVVLQMQTPQVTVTTSEFWLIASYRGHKVVEHSGNIDGFRAYMTFMPQDGIGMVILTNLFGNSLPMIVSYNVYDRMLGLDQVPWIQRVKEVRSRQAAVQESSKSKPTRTPPIAPGPSHELSAFAGEYRHPGYGSFTIRVEEGKLRLTRSRASGWLEHLRYDTFEIPPDIFHPFEKLPITCITNANGEVDSVMIPLEPAVRPIVFARKVNGK